MWTLENAFSKYGAPAKEMNETFYIYHPRADTIESLKRIKEHDKWTAEQIEGLRQFADMLEEYRRTLHERAQEFYSAPYSMRLNLPAALTHGQIKNTMTWNYQKSMTLKTPHPKT